MKVKGALIAHRHTASSCISPLAIGLAVAVAISHRESAGGADRGTGLPHVISCSPDDLAAAKTSLASGDTRLMPALQQLLRDADQGLRQAAVSVLEKETSVDGAARCDYVSFAPYWWPNPNSADGLPYIRKDGQHNRDRRALGDVGNFSAVKRSVSALALGYYFTDDTRYARHAADLLRAWFLDPKTGMNPNLNHAQAVPGVATGRPAGLIEFRDMPQLLDSLGLLERSPDWGEPDRKAMRAWLTSYYDWLTTNPMALKEQKAANNHGTWYDVQAAALALYIDRPDDARRIAKEFGPNRIASQVEADGRQPRELARVDSWGYSTFNVAAMIGMAELAERVGVDIWRFQTGDGRSIKAAIGYLTPYLEEGRKWPHDQGGSGSIRRGQLSSPLLRAMRGLGPDSYERFYLSFPRSEREARRERLLYDRR